MDAHRPAPSELAPGTVDDLFAVLSSEERRHVVQYFRQASGSVADVDSLVDYSVQLADGDVDRTERTITLHHVALPKLADAGVLDYDARHGTVRYRGCPAAERLVGQTVDLEAGRPTAGDRREETREHLEAAVRADEPATKDYHVREALQSLSIADGASHGRTGDENTSAE